MTTANEKLTYLQNLQNTQITGFSLDMIINGNSVPSWFSLAIGQRVKNNLAQPDSPFITNIRNAIISSAKDELRDAIAAKKAELDALKAQLDNLNLGNP